MEIVENTLDGPIDEVLDRPLFCFLATLSRAGDPRVSPLWYLWEDERLWIIGDAEKSYIDRLEAHPEASVAVVDSAPTRGCVRHVGMRGTADIDPFDSDRANRLLRRYLGPDESDWDPRFRDLDPERWRFVRFDPRTVVARDQSFAPSLDGD